MNKKLKIGIKVVAGIALLFVLILAFHIITAKPAVYENSNLQISRIDFKNTIDSAQAKKISSDLRSIKGITSDSIIIEKNVLVYFHNNSITNSEKVYSQLMTKGNYNAKQYVLDPGIANRPVCPIDQNSFSYKLSQKINHFFN